MAESQRITLRNGLGERADGSWAAATIADFGPRQGTGKNDKIAARELAGLVLFGEKLIIHTAHEFSTSNEAFLRMVAIFDNYDDLRRRVKRIRYANGEQGIDFLSGQRLKYRARTGGAGRGFAKADLVVYDEAQHLQVEHVAASGPAKMANPNSQAWYAGSGGLMSSVQAWKLRRQAILAEPGRLAYTEMTGETITVDDAGAIKTTPPDPLDLEVWYACIPGLGRWVTEESVRDLYDELGAEMFMREILCVWDPLPSTENRQPKMDAAAWQSTARHGVRAVDPVRLAFDVDMNGASASIVASSGTIAKPVVDCVTPARQGVTWLPGRIVELVKAHKPLAIGCNGAGPAGAQVGAIQMALRDAGEKIEIQQLNATEYQQACGGFHTDVINGTLRRPDDQLPLDLAGADATERTLVEAWVWARRQATVPISPLVAATVARALLPTEAAAPSEGDFIVI